LKCFSGAPSGYQIICPPPGCYAGYYPNPGLGGVHYREFLHREKPTIRIIKAVNKIKLLKI
jgi:hypothetical protein